MSERKKAILFGDYTHPVYHPLNGVDAEICSILENEYSVACTEDYAMLASSKLNGYDLCLCYADQRENKLPDDCMAGFISFIVHGGGLLVIHNGISLQKRYEYAQLVGAKFRHHPPYQKLEFRATAAEHSISQGITGFEMEEEPYQFDFCSFTEKTVIFEYLFEGKSFPAAWVHEFGLGKVAYLMPGHHVHSFKNPEYREIIRRSAAWAGNGKSMHAIDVLE